MRITRKQLVQELKEATDYTFYDLFEVMKTLQRIVFEHIKNQDEVCLFTGVRFSGVLNRSHLHHSEFIGDFMTRDYVQPKVTYTEGFKEFIRGGKGVRLEDDDEDEENDCAD